MDKHIAIIPARAGSKSIKDKNLQKIGSKSLIERTINLALASGIFSEIIISTDIPAIIDEYKDGKKTIIRERPHHLATDSAVMYDVVVDALSVSKADKSSYFWLFQPTSPFRNQNHIKEISELIEKRAPKSLISVTDVASRHPNRMYTFKHGKLYPLKFTSFQNKQELPTVYIRNGAFYVCRIDAFFDCNSFFCNPCIPYFMDDKESINIDSKFDLEVARMVHG